MNKTQQRIEQIGAILSRPERPSTLKAIGEAMNIDPAWVGKIIERNEHLQIIYFANKKLNLEKKLSELRNRIEQKASQCGVSISKACVMLGYNSSYYAGLGR